MVNDNSSIAIDSVKPQSNLNCNAVDAYGTLYKLLSNSGSYVQFIAARLYSRGNQQPNRRRRAHKLPREVAARDAASGPVVDAQMQAAPI